MRRATFFVTLVFAAVRLLLVVSGNALAASGPTELVKSGYSLTQSDADRLEKSLGKKPDDEPVRLKLLGYYATIPQSVPAATIRQRRAEHILWLVEKNPKCGLFEYAGATWKIYPKVMHSLIPTPSKVEKHSG